MAAALTDFRSDKDSRIGKLLGRLGLMLRPHKASEAAPLSEDESGDE